MRNLILSVYYKAEIFHKDGNFSGNFGAKGSHDMNLPGKFVTIDIFEFSIMLYFIPVKLCTFSLTGKVNLMTVSNIDKAYIFSEEDRIYLTSVYGQA